jgi:hypothetical protein
LSASVRRHVSQHGQVKMLDDVSELPRILVHKILILKVSSTSSARKLFIGAFYLLA